MRAFRGNWSLCSFSLKELREDHGDSCFFDATRELVCPPRFMPNLDFRTTNTLWCSVLVETLARLGLTHAIISPGSRSTALTLAFARHGAIESISVLDERSAAFFALGLAKQRQRPVVLVCTSGTAAANYFPAVIEAHEAGIPLLVLTADRPPEMRACNSGQTIDQQKIFGDYTKWQHELCVPEAGLERLRYLRQMILHAWERAIGPFPGPVHVNAPFRDPLAPVENASPGPIAEVSSEEFFAHLQAPDIHVSAALYRLRPQTARGVIIAGAAAPADPGAYAHAVLALGVASGWPVLADVLSPLRTHAPAGSGVVTTYDTLLRRDALARDLNPRQVLCLGGWPTSKILRGWIERSQAEIVLIAPGPANRDAIHGKTRQVVAQVESLAIEGRPPADDSYRQAWLRADAAARMRLDTALADGSTGLFEGKAAWILARALPPATPVFVAASMPVRDLEYFWPNLGGGQRLYFNRGANGIDGTLSTALGVAHGHAPAVLLSGDLALLHDTNGFLTASKLRGSLTVVLINNEGGGIFEHLPVAAFDPPFEQFFATPQQVDFAKLSSAYGVEHRMVSDWAEFERLVTTLPSSGVRVLEIRTERKRDAAYRKKLFAQIAGEVERACQASG